MKIVCQLFSITLLLGSCGCDKTKDRGPQQALTRTWTCEIPYASGGDFESTTFLGSDGRYVAHGTVTGSNGVRTLEVEGTWEIKDGFLIDTVTKHSWTNAPPTPYTTRAAIIRSNDQELVVKWEGMTNEVVLKRKK